MITATVQEWQTLLRQFKETLAQRLWSVPSLSETEKGLLFKEYLADLDALEQTLAEIQEESLARQKTSAEENELLRGLLGLSDDEVKAKNLTVMQDLASTKQDVAALEDEAAGLRTRAAELTDENEQLRKRLHELERQSERVRVDHLKQRDGDIKFFSETHEALKNQLKDLEFQLTNLRELFTETNQKLRTEKQEEIALLQKKLLDEMETVLRRKQELSWGEEEMFAQGVAQKVRTTLVSAQGQLLLTLERLGLLDPAKKTEAFWKARLRLLVEGAPELAENFRAIQAQLQQVTSALDDYMHLTHRREVTKEPVALKDVVQAKIAEIYEDRQPTVSVEFLSDDPLPVITGDPVLLKFTIEALLRNALEALPGGAGQVVISLKNQSEKGRIQVLVRDSGSGVPAHLQNRLFQPFFTTKQHRQGLSLSRARRYVELHGGLLEILQTGSQGTTFLMELPLTPGRLLPNSLGHEPPSPEAA